MTPEEKLAARWRSYDAGIGDEPYIPRGTGARIGALYLSHDDVRLSMKDAARIEREEQDKANIGATDRA